MEEYYEHYEQHKGSPPDYDALTSSPRLQRKFNIQPRDDEGREALPPYSCAISLENVFMKKNELEGAVHRSQDRNWHRVFVKLQGTALSFHNYKGNRVMERLAIRDGMPNADMPDKTKKGEFLQSYNLQHADVGIAADYIKKRYVIRVRAETDQFLLSCTTLETFVQWLQSLFAAIDLAPPLDDREIPRDISIPRVRRSRCVRFTGDVRNTALVQDQARLISETYPHLVGNEITQVPSSSSSAGGRINTPSTPPRPLTASVPAFSPRRPKTAPVLPRPSIDEESGKWHPDSQWSAMHDMMYAKRCMAVLMHRSPRKTNYVIMKGKQWIVDWATGKLTRWGPPEYDEEVGDGKEELRISQYGSPIRG